MTALVTALLQHRDAFNGVVTTAENTVTTEEGELDAVQDTVDSAQELYDAALTNDAYTEAVDDLAMAQKAFDDAEDAYFDAIVAATGITTVEDVTAAVEALAPLTAAVAEAQTTVDNAIQAVADAKAELPEGLAAAQDAYDDASEALDDAGARGLASDEILSRNDGDLEGTIGNVDIRNKTTLLSATEVADITNDLGVSVVSASAIAAATDVGSVNGMDTLGESRDGVLVGGNDGDLDEDELLIYIV